MKLTAPGRFIATVLLTIAATAVSVSGATPAQAAAPCSQVSCVYNYNASQVPAWCWDGCTPGTVGLGNGTKISMSCWWDADPYTGNYRSNRYFAAWVIPFAGRRLVHSSYVFNQVGVGRC